LEVAVAVVFPRVESVVATVAVFAFVVVIAGCPYAITPTVGPAFGPFAGSVTFTESPGGDASVEMSFTSKSAVATGCTGTTVGKCCVTTQPALDTSTGDKAPSAVDAGRIDLRDGLALMASAASTPFGYHPLSSAGSAGLHWNPGDSLEASAPGAKFPGFDLSVDAPQALARVVPDLTNSANTVVCLNHDFTVSWTPTPGAAGEVTLEIFDVVGLFVDCTTAEADGTITAPAETMKDVAANDTGTITLSHSATATKSLTGADIDVTATTTAEGVAVFIN
jgi:hypothetical protein